MPAEQNRQKSRIHRPILAPAPQPVVSISLTRGHLPRPSTCQGRAGAQTGTWTCTHPPPAPRQEPATFIDRKESMGARQRVERRKRPRVSSSSWKPLSTVPAQPWSSHHPYCRGRVGEYLSFISGPTPASHGADPHPPRDRRPYEAASPHAKLRLLNACSARTYLSSPQPAALLCTSTHRALPPPCCHGDRPGPQQPLIGPTRRVEGADWQGRRPGRAGGLGGGRCGELTRRSPGEGEPGGTWRSAARAEKPRPFLLWLSWRVPWSRIWVGEVLTRDADKNPGISSPSAAGPRRQLPDWSETGC